MENKKDLVVILKKKDGRKQVMFTDCQLVCSYVRSL